MRTWRCYLEGTYCTIVTDHNSLVYIKTQHTLSRRQARWLECLKQNFIYRWIYRPGRINMADPLSRNPLDMGGPKTFMAPKVAPSNSIF